MMLSYHWFCGAGVAIMVSWREMDGWTLRSSGALGSDILSNRKSPIGPWTEELNRRSLAAG